MLGAIVATVLLGQGEADDVLLMDSELLVEGESIGLEFLLLPLGQGIGDLLERLGLYDRRDRHRRPHGRARRVRGSARPASSRSGWGPASASCWSTASAASPGSRT